MHITDRDRHHSVLCLDALVPQAVHHAPVLPHHHPALGEASVLYHHRHSVRRLSFLAHCPDGSLRALRGELEPQDPRGTMHQQHRLFLCGPVVQFNLGSRYPLRTAPHSSAFDCASSSETAGWHCLGFGRSVSPSPTPLLSSLIEKMVADMSPSL